MLIPEFYPAALAITPSAAGTSLRAWAVGQILEATVVRQSADGSVTLRIGAGELQARTGLALSTDQPLTLQVTQAGSRVVLRVVHASATDAVLAQAWRQALPRQAELGPLLAELARSLDLTTTGVVTRPITTLVKQLVARLPDSAAVGTAAGLKRAVRDSGVFLEAKLAEPAAGMRETELATDLKANLLRLAAPLRAQPAIEPGGGVRADGAAPATFGADTAAVTTLAQRVEGGLARIQYHQLAALAAEGGGALGLALEIPVRHADRTDVWGMRIERDAAGRADEAPAWVVWLSFDFPELGPVEVRVGVRAGQVTTALWAIEPDTATLFDQHRHELEERLRGAGLIPAACSCHTGVAPRARDDTPPPVLLDEHA